MSLLSTPGASSSDPTLERSFRGHRAPATCVSFSPSLRQLASGGQDHQVIVWNFKPQLRAFRFVGHKGVVTSVEFSPTGHLLASASTDNTVRLWEPTVYVPDERSDEHRVEAHCETCDWTGETTNAVHAHVEWECMSTADALLFVRRATLHPAASTACSRGKCSILKAHSAPVRSVSWSSDSKLLITASDDKTCKVGREEQRGASERQAQRTPTQRHL
jgi:centriolar protein POC1